MIQDSVNSQKVFSTSYWLWKYFPCKVVEMLEVVVSWREVKQIWHMNYNFVAQFIQLLKCWLYDL